MNQAARSRPDGRASTSSLLVPGHNCWRVERSLRTHCIQDAAEYFERARAAILRAQHSVFLVGWDIHANLDLVPGRDDGLAPTALAELLDFVVRRRRHLHCHVLVWDHAALYALERDPFTRIKLGWLTHRRVHFRFDDQHPLGASHHEKLLVVDDTVAFSGGIDFTSHRWDTVAHRLDEPLRIGNGGAAYGPYHDVQLMVEGPAARALGELARARWTRVGWRRLPPLATDAASVWPDDLPSDLPPVSVGLARTEPPFRREPGTREVEALFLDSIAAAKRSIYIENQYFTDAGVARALAARLAEANGPDVIVIGPKQCSGWLERQTMGVLRDAVSAELVAADRHGRLRLLNALASQRLAVPTFIHAKVMIVDDELLRVGSANLASRSMGMDSECDLAAAADGDPATQRGIAQVRARLLAEHLGVAADQVAAACAHEGSLARGIDGLCGGDRSLVAVTMTPSVDTSLDTMRDLIDPCEPIVARFDGALPELEACENRGRRVARTLPLLVATAAAGVIWRASWLASDRSLEGMAALLREAPSSPSVLLLATVAFMVAGLTFLPLQLLTLAGAFVLGPWAGAATATAGSLLAAGLGYRLGRHLGPGRLAQWIGHRVYRLLRTMHRPSLLSMVTMRLLPIVSATTLHLLCGAGSLPRGIYWRGTLLGSIPPIAVVCVVGGLLRYAFLEHATASGAFGAAIGLVWIAAMLRLRRRLLQQHADRVMREQDPGASFG